MEQTSLFEHVETTIPENIPKFEEEEKAYEIIKPYLYQIVEDWYLPLNLLKAEAKEGYYSVTLSGSVVCRIHIRGKKHYIVIPESSVQYVPVGTEYTQIKSDEGCFIRLNAECYEDISKYIELICKVLEAEILKLPKDFDCCHLYMECSDAKKCLNSNRDFAKGCGYKFVLKSGRVFYGSNRNIDELGQVVKL